jgi:regulator of replication initiation timing
MEKLNEFMKKIYTQPKKIETIKEELSKSLEEKMLLNMGSIRGDIDANRNRIEDLMKRLDYLSLAINSFGRTIKMMNIDEIVRRFDALDKRIMALQTEVDKLRVSLETTSVAKEDLEVIKERIKEMSSTFLQTMNKMNEFELRVNKKLAGWDRMQRLIRELSELEKLKEDLIKIKQGMSEI